MANDQNAKINKCKWSYPLIAEAFTKWGCDNILVDKKNIDEKYCESCDKFKSRFIEFPIEVKEIENEDILSCHSFYECGKMCAIRPFGEQYENKTFIGILLGELPVKIHTKYNSETGKITNSVINNPAIYVPQLKKIIYGMESWWHTIENEEQFKKITDEDIDNIWYVQSAKKIFKDNN